MELSSEWLETLYSKEDLAVGKELNLPWPSKERSVTYWKAVVVDDTSIIFFYNVVL